MEGFYDITAISFHAYPYVQDKYAIMPPGQRWRGLRPHDRRLAALALDELKQLKIACRNHDHAYLALKAVCSRHRQRSRSFDRSFPSAGGKYEAGLIIHEGTDLNKSGCTRLWTWASGGGDQTGLPLPLGGNVIRRDLSPELMAACCTALRDSIRYALDNRDEALQYAMQFARDLELQMVDKFVACT